MLRIMVTPANPSALPVEHEHGSAQQIRCVCLFRLHAPPSLFLISLFFFASAFSTDLPLHLFLISLLFFACIFFHLPTPSHLFLISSPFVCVVFHLPALPSLPRLSSLFACIFSLPPFLSFLLSALLRLCSFLTRTPIPTLSLFCISARLYFLRLALGSACDPYARAVSPPLSSPEPVSTCGVVEIPLRLLFPHTLIWLIENSTTG